MRLEPAGIAAYVVSAEALGAELVRLAGARVDAVEHHDFVAAFGTRAWPAALAELGDVLGQSGRVLSEAAACALCDAVRRAGVALGAIEVAPAEAERFRAWAGAWLPRALGAADAAARALEGGFLELRGSGAFELGSLPLDALRAVGHAEVDDARRARDDVPAGEAAWAAALVELLRAAARLAPDHGDAAAVVFVPLVAATGDEATVEAPQDLPDGPPDDASSPPSIAALLAKAVELDASDLVLTAGGPPLLRIAGRLRPLNAPALEPDDVRYAAYALITDLQREAFERASTLRTSFGVKGLGRFRLTLFLQRGCVAASVRVHAREAARVDLPAALVDAVLGRRSGVVLVAGAAGSGRTTTAAALAARLAGAGRAVLGLEAPIELPLSHGQAVVHQVELCEQPGAPGASGPSLDDALAVARDLDVEVVLLDQVDHPARLEAALALAAQGRLVVTTIAAADARDAVSRAFALGRGAEPAWRDQLARRLVVVVAQRLVDGRREVELLVDPLAPT